MSDIQAMQLSKWFWLGQAAFFSVLTMFMVVGGISMFASANLGADALPPFVLNTGMSILFQFVATTWGQSVLNRLPMHSPFRLLLRRAVAVWLAGLAGMWVLDVVSSVLIDALAPGFNDPLDALFGKLPPVVLYLQAAVVNSVILGTWFALSLAVRGWQQHSLVTRAQLDLLRYQLNPHFLFNTLNSLRGLISESPERAEKMVQNLADFLRSTLTPSRDGMLPLAQELELTRNYLALEQIRFEDALQVSFDVDEPARNLMVPTLLLNPLVENAVKFGYRTSATPLKIDVSVKLEPDGIRLEVSNTGTLVPVENDRARVGLRNVRDRLKLLFARSTFDLTEANGWVRATIRLPLEHLS